MITKNTPQFDKFVFYPGLIAIRETNTKKIIGYVNFHSLEQAWFWFIGSSFSEFYATEDHAIESLIRQFVINKFDSFADKKGMLNNEDYVMGK